jgi:hypothetical protein
MAMVSALMHPATLSPLPIVGAVTKLPKPEHSAPEWQAAMEALILVAETGGPHDVGPDRRHAGIEPSRRTGL